MIHQTNVTIFGCRIWLEAPNQREFKRKEKKLIKWVEHQLQQGFGIIQPGDGFIETTTKVSYNPESSDIRPGFEKQL